MDHVVVAPLLVLLAVVDGGWIARATGGRVPLSLVQIGLGGLLAATTDLGLALDPEIFFLFFLPPLLFLDGWRIPKDGRPRSSASSSNSPSVFSSPASSPSACCSTG
jgi:CPA1 family monovalent cation:H+ antiporter